VFVLHALPQHFSLVNRKIGNSCASLCFHVTFLSSSLHVRPYSPGEKIVVLAHLNTWSRPRAGMDGLRRGHDDEARVIIRPVLTQVSSHRGS
jgi:hypothetical protein